MKFQGQTLSSRQQLDFPNEFGDQFCIERPQNTALLVEVSLETEKIENDRYNDETF
jgi:hypothetical protein